MSALQPELRKPTEVTVHETVGVLPIDHLELAKRGLDISVKENQISQEVRDRMIDAWSHLEKVSGPELAGMDNAAESGQQQHVDL